MLTVYKYPLLKGSQVCVGLPKGAKILTVQVQNGVPHIWALVNPENPLVERFFRLAGTGCSIEEHKDDLHYVGTFQLFKGRKIYHLFEVKFGVKKG